VREWRDPLPRLTRSWTDSIRLAANAKRGGFRTDSNQCPAQVLTKLIADRPERGQSLSFRSHDGSWIRERLVQLRAGTQEDRTGFSGVVTHGQHAIERLTRELGDRLGPLVADVDSDLAHHLDGFRPHDAWSCAYAVGVDLTVRIVTEQSLRH